MSAPTALYRRYRPDSFADVIGQEHVTAPLMAALDKDRVNHAYLFSGPRGCGKTTSARILARCLNCAQGPTSHPCGTCASCVELARGGSGSLDVIEIDAASHGGVDDARDLRERATFAPIRDRYKIFIIDEAHMVTSAGFNALLKIVEEPPEHIKFIFATTEPDKVIGTIRSRTHHYPFRLVPPEPLMKYLSMLCQAENVPVAPGVLSLVIRAGGGSVRDSLSVLDQLMAGAGTAGLDYELAVDLLGYTHASLLDDVVEALAASDSATVFKSVDRVIQTGHDPRRFVEDLLERFRDLIIVQAMPENAHAILRGTPEELIARMQTQAAQLGAAELSRAADVTNAAFNEMTGASSPRLHLELLGARLLLPGADASVRGMTARLDAMERRLNYAGAPAQAGEAAETLSAPSQAASSISPSNVSPGPDVSPGDASQTFVGGLAAVRAQLAKAKADAGAQVASRRAPASATSAKADVPTWDDLSVQDSSQTLPVQSAPATATSSGTKVESAPDPTSATPTHTGMDSTPASAPAPATATATATAPASTPAPAAQIHADAPAAVGTSGIEVIRRAWPEILSNLGNIRKASWALVNQNVVPRAFDGETLRVALPTTALIQTFEGSGHSDNLRQAIHTTLGISCQIDPITGDGPSRETSAEPNPKVPAESPRPSGDGPTGDAIVGTATTGVAGSAAPASAAHSNPVPAAAPDSSPVPAAAPDSSAAPDAAPAAGEWDGPIPQEPEWDHEPVEDNWAPEATPAPALTQAPDRPKVSSISAWTTGWDLPPASAKTAAALPQPSATPRHHELLAAQAQQSTDQATPADTSVDWGVSLGAASRNHVADPGWGAPGSAPDWSQAATAPAAQQTSDGAPATPTPSEGAPAVAPAPESPAPESSASASTASSATVLTLPAAVPPEIFVAPASGEKLSRYQQLSNSAEAKASRAQAASNGPDAPYVEDVPSPDDVTLEESGVAGQGAVERILGGVLIEERPLNTTR